MQHLSAIDELAIMDVLCCDKTGTLTLNRVRLTPEAVPAFIDGVGADDLLTAAALATKWRVPRASRVRAAGFATSSA